MNSLPLIASCLMSAAAVFTVVVAVSAIIDRPLRRGQLITKRDGWFMLCGAVFFGCEALSVWLDYDGWPAITVFVIGLVVAVPWLVHQARSLTKTSAQPPQQGRPLHD